jgi:hypothetical protein
MLLGCPHGKIALLMAFSLALHAGTELHGVASFSLMEPVLETHKK